MSRSIAPDRAPTPLAGKQVLVTGATAGIGRATALAFAREGANVVAVGRRRERLEELARAIGDTPGSCRPVELDIRDAKTLERLHQERPELFSRTEILVNNAGLARGRDPVAEARMEDWQEMVDTNVMALLRMTRYVLPYMVARGSGHVVNLGSVAGRWTYRGGAVYTATKFAVRAFSEGIRHDTLGSGVRVTNVEPGLVETEFSLVRLGDGEKAKQVYADMVPLVPEDIADVILWSCRLPRHVNLQEVVVYPTDQADVTTVHRRRR